MMSKEPKLNVYHFTPAGRNSLRVIRCHVVIADSEKQAREFVHDELRRENLFTMDEFAVKVTELKEGVVFSGY